jgi:hypothetical protein
VSWVQIDALRAHADEWLRQGVIAGEHPAGTDAAGKDHAPG